ncbi:MAG TPA: hypothetical protein VEB59_12950 [Gemmatimonadales bacterium]|nr:hypothetical protein [Gemmatimonadales bacterium]
MPARVVHLIPHTHWDREWYLTAAGFLARLVPMLDDLLELLEAEPRFRTFLLDGQTVLLEDYLRVRPERRAKVAALVAAGRLQAGPWYVLADELIPSGESLVRNLLAGAADAARLGGRLDVLYCPDAFGHPAVLPTVAAEFGIRHAVVWRGLGTPGADRDLHRWRGPDGRELVVFHLPPDGYEIGAALPADWERVRDIVTARASSPHLGVMVGADHHAAHPALLAAAADIAAREPHHEVRVSRLDEFLGLAAAESGGLPVVEGELRWSYGYTWTLQGVHGTRAALKRKHSLVELALERAAEPLAALALALGVGDSRALLDAAWRMLLRSQFHDSLAGCTADAVARRVEARIEDAGTIAEEIARASADRLLGNDPDRARDHPESTAPALVVWNPAARPRAGVAIADLTWLRRDVLVGPPGARKPRVGASPAREDVAEAVGGLPFQMLGRALGHERLDSPHHYPDQDEVEITRVAVVVPAVGGLGLAVAGDPGTGDPPELEPVSVRDGELDNGLVRLTVDRLRGVALTDRRAGVAYENILAIESEPDFGDTYTPAPGGPVTRGPARWGSEIVAAGPLVGALAIRARVASVDLRITLGLQSGSRAVRCTIELDNRRRDHRLRLRVRGAAPGEATLSGAPFGAVRRSLVRRVSPGGAETPVPTAPAHRWVAGGADGGIALLAPGFFEYEHTSEGDLLFTILRAVGQLSRADLPTRPGHAAWPTPSPLAQAPGPDRLQIALLACGPAPGGRPAELAEAWEDVFLPLRPVWLRQATRLAVPSGSLTLEGRDLVLSAVKPAAEGDGIVLRCCNTSAEVVEGAWRLPFAAGRAWRVRADEREPEALVLDDGGRTVRFRAGPRAIVSVLLRSISLTADTVGDELRPPAARRAGAAREVRRRAP